jgi:hypothetical protein
MAASQHKPSRQGARVSLIQVKVIEGVFTTPQKREIVTRLTDAMVEIQGDLSRAWSKRSRAARPQARCRSAPGHSDGPSEEEATMQTPTVIETRRAGQKPRTTRALVVQSLLLGIRAEQPKNGMGAR